MMKAVATLCTLAPVKGVIVNPRGVEVGPDIPILDSHNVRNGCLGHLERAWVEDDMLMAELIFTGRAGAVAYRQIERGFLDGVSCGLRTESIAIFDTDGPLDIEEALKRGSDDPDLIVVAQRSVLREVSITTMPADRNARVRAIGFEAECWRMIRQGERELEQILRPDRHGDDGNNVWQRIMADRKLVHYGTPGEIL